MAWTWICSPPAVASQGPGIAVVCRRSGAISLETHRPPPHTAALCLLGRSPSPSPDLSPASVSRCPCPGYESSAEWSRVSWCLGSFSLVDETTCLKPELRKKELLSSQFAGVSVHYRLAVRQHRAEGHSSWWRRTVKVSRAGRRSKPPSQGLQAARLGGGGAHAPSHSTRQ